MSLSSPGAAGEVLLSTAQSGPTDRPEDRSSDAKPTTSTGRGDDAGGSEFQEDPDDEEHAQTETVAGELSSFSSDEPSDEETWDTDVQPWKRRKRHDQSADSNQVDAGELEALKQEQNEQIDGDAAPSSNAASRLGRGKRRAVTAGQMASTGLAEKLNSEADIAATKQAEQKAWEAFQAATSTEQSGEEKAGQVRTIKVTEKYRFAGEDVVKQRLLPVDHPDGIAYLRRNPAAAERIKDGRHAGTVATQLADASRVLTNETHSMQSSAFQTTTCASSTKSTAPIARINGAGLHAGLRKRASKLSALAASAESNAGKKMNTLEKSKMDWEGWKQQGSKSQSQRELDEMEEQTRTGSGVAGNSMSGYLGRKDFLDRVRNRTGG